MNVFIFLAIVAFISAIAIWIASRSPNTGPNPGQKAAQRLKNRSLFLTLHSMKRKGQISKKDMKAYDEMVDEEYWTINDY